MILSHSSDDGLALTVDDLRKFLAAVDEHAKKEGSGPVRIHSDNNRPIYSLSVNLPSLTLRTDNNAWQDKKR